MKRLSLLLGASLVLPIAPDAFAQIDREATLACINDYKKLGVSVDAAFAECSKRSLFECVQDLLGKKYVAKAVGKKDNRYLVDLGSDQARWMEGAGWKKHGCTAYIDGPTKAEVADPGRGLLRMGKYNYTWYRQGLCGADSIEVEQPYTSDEAKTYCQLQGGRLESQAEKMPSLTSEKERK